MSASKGVRFVASDPARGGLPMKRRQVEQACEDCRRKKRRCLHAHDSVDRDRPEETPGQSVSPHQSQVNSTLAPRRSARLGLSDQDETGPAPNGNYFGSPHAYSSASPSVDRQRPPRLESSSRFIGDLNPEGMFIEATGSASKRQASTKGDIGIWYAASSLQGSQFIPSRPLQIIDHLLLPFVRENCLSCLPPEQDFRQFERVFYKRIHPLLPIIPQEELHGDLNDPTIIVLRQLVCLAAALDPSVGGHLRLSNRGPNTLNCQEFSRSLSSALQCTLETSIITDRMLHIKALVLLSLYTQPASPEESDLPAQLGSRAIHHVQTLGLHLHQFEGPNSDEIGNLFCAVWAIDKINGAMYGRPCLFHERDIGNNFGACLKGRSPCFRLFLNVVQCLDDIIELYRPRPKVELTGNNTTTHMELPVLEWMIVEARALEVPSHLIATIETFYHAVIILSCRLPRPGTVEAATSLPPPTANSRRSLAAERIASIIPRYHLSPIPLVPYALSLALSVEYRKMRHSRLPMFRARAMVAFKRDCEILRTSCGDYWNARVVANLGDRILKEIEKTASAMNGREDTPSPPPFTNTPPNAASRQNDITPLPADMSAGDSTLMNDAPGDMPVEDFSLMNEIGGQDFFKFVDSDFMNAAENVMLSNLDVAMPFDFLKWNQLAMPEGAEGPNAGDVVPN